MVDVLIQTQNEELNLPETLASLQGWVNRVFVVDSGSTDRTVEIAQSFGCTVVHHAWEGYAAQKNWALDNLPFESQWILIVDADEAVSPELRDEIRRITDRQVDEVRESAFHINRVFIFMGREIRHCGYFPSWNLRLFKRGHARYEQRLVHEHMIVTGPTGDLTGLLIHNDKRGLEYFVAKHNRYSTLEAIEIFNARERWPGLHAFLTDRVSRRRYLKNRVLPFMPLPWVIRFLWMYVVKLGFLDGSAGWHLCLFISCYEYFIRMKYVELKLTEGRSPQNVRGLSVPEGKMRTQDTATTAGPAGDPAGGTGITILPASSSPRPLLPEALPSKADRPSGEPSRGSVLPPPGPTVLTSKAPVSVLIPTLNEGKNIARCLDHLTWADEVVVVDSGSKDDTVTISRQYGATVADFRWNGAWPKKKNWALRNLPWRNEWILIVDADEWITPELADEIIRTVKNPKHEGYYINRRFIFMGGWIKHCGYYPSWNLRLLRRGKGEYEQLTEIGDTGSGDNEVHEHVKVDGSVGYLENDMLHFAFPSIQVFMEKHNRYSNWEAMVQYKGVEAEGLVQGNAQLSRRRWLKNLSRRMPFRPMLRFLYSYIFQGGFLDGRPGYVFCRLLAIYEYLSVAKYYELKQADESNRKSRQISAVPSQLPALRAASEAGKATASGPTGTQPTGTQPTGTESTDAQSTEALPAETSQATAPAGNPQAVGTR